MIVDGANTVAEVTDENFIKTNLKTTSLTSLGRNCKCVNALAGVEF